MSIFDFDNAMANSGVSGVNSAAEKQAQNKADFDNAINILAGYFSGDVASKFMSSASQHAANLAKDTENIRQTASNLDNIRQQALRNIENQSK